MERENIGSRKAISQGYFASTNARCEPYLARFKTGNSTSMFVC